MGLVALGLYQVVATGSLLQRAAYDLRVVSQNLADGRSQAAERSLGFAQANASSARRKASGPLLWLGERVPFFGDDVQALRTAASVMDDLAQDTLPDLVEAGRSISPAALRPSKGRVELEPIKRVAPVLDVAAAEVERASERVAVIDPAELSGGLRKPMLDLQEQLRGAAALARRGALAARLMPAMLGDKGARTYALITQNNAEVRSTGGIPGSVAIVRANRGFVQIVEQGNEGEFGFWDPPVVPPTAEERALYGDLIATYPQDVTFTPDFPRAAQILHAMWQRKRGQSLDGVLSVDPVAMSYILYGTGPVKLPDGGLLQPYNVVSTLLNLIYLAQPNFEAQDDFFELVGRTIFNTVRAGTGRPTAVLDGLTLAVDERRILVWSAHPDEQSLLEGTPISGDMPRRATVHPQVGMYLNDAASDKMSFYLDYKVDVKPRTCNSDGSQVLDVKLTMKSSAPTDIAEFGRPLAPGPLPGPELGTIRTTANLYAPFGGRVLEATLEEQDAPAGDFRHLGRPVSSVTLDVKPQQSRVVEYSVLTGPDQRGDVELRTTPAALGMGRGTVGQSACN